MFGVGGGVVVKRRGGGVGRGTHVTVGENLFGVVKWGCLGGGGLWQKMGGAPEN